MKILTVDRKSVKVLKKENKILPETQRTENSLRYIPVLFVSFLIVYFEIMLYLQKACKDSTELPYTLHPASPNVNVLCNDGTMVKSKKLTLVQYH